MRISFIGRQFYCSLGPEAQKDEDRTHYVALKGPQLSSK